MPESPCRPVSDGDLDAIRLIDFDAIDLELLRVKRVHLGHRCSYNVLLCRIHRMYIVLINWLAIHRFITCKAGTHTKIIDNLEALSLPKLATKLAANVPFSQKKEKSVLATLHWWREWKRLLRSRNSSWAIHRRSLTHNGIESTASTCPLSGSLVHDE